MKEIKLQGQALKSAINQGFDETIAVVVDAIYDSIGGNLDGQTMPLLNANQITLLAYNSLHGEVMDGGFVQLIHNGYGDFIFRNPFDKVLKTWGLLDLAKLIDKCHKLFNKYGDDIKKDCTDEEFMALFEQYDAFDDYDDAFVENEVDWSEQIANYVVDHIADFVTITHDE